MTARRHYSALFTRIFASISNIHIPCYAPSYMILNQLHSSPARSSMTPTEEDVLCSTLEDCTLSPNSSDAAAFELIDCSVLPSKDDEWKHSSNAIERPVGDGGRVERAWEHWRNLGEPKFIVAPMVDQSELPFRMLCRKYGATAAYTPMLHSRLFAEDPKYRRVEFTTCKEDRPLFVQFCANDPERLLAAAEVVQPYCDYVDINLGTLYWQNEQDH